MKISSTKKNFVWYYIYQMILLSSPLITTPYISRVLGSEKIGIFSFTFSVANFFYVIAQLGTQSYGVREIVKTRDDKNNMTKTFIEIEIMTIITTFLCILFFLIFIFLQQQYKILFLLWILFILSAAVDVSWFFAGIEHFEEIFTRNIFFRLLGIILIFTCIKSKKDLFLYIIIYSCTYLLSNICMWMSLKKYLSIRGLSNLNLLKHFKESLFYFIPAITSSIYVILDKSMLGFLVLDKRESGYYEMTYNIIRFGISISSIVITRIFESKTTYFYKNSDFDKIKESIKISFNFTMTIACCIIFGILSLAGDFVPIYFGNDFLPVANLLRLMSPLIIITAITYIFEYEYLVPSGKRNEINKYVVIGAMINLILNIFFIRYFKSLGAVVTTIIAEFIIMESFYYKTNNFFPLSSICKIFKNKFFAGICMFLSIEMLKYFFNIIHLKNIYLSFFLEITLGIVIYCIIIVVCKDPVLKFKSDIENL